MSNRVREDGKGGAIATIVLQSQVYICPYTLGVSHYFRLCIYIYMAIITVCIYKYG